ncbi:hypothetical protein M3Y96_00958300 [Aphelenchoides besseyi]|nr:hypothetical protein M3Y96_00958300 [Aphelenchoides besseyi]
MDNAQETRMENTDTADRAPVVEKPQTDRETIDSKNIVANGTVTPTNPNKTGGNRANKTVQPNFDFDYDGPPVIVSNGMALELVNRFGLNNAWGAFLKLKGYHAPYDKNAPQPPEHVQALKRFRRKIRGVREMFNALRDKNEDTIPLMSKEFVVLLKGTTDSADVDEPNNSNGKETKAEEDDAASDKQDKTPDPTTANGAVPADPTHPKRPRKSARKDTKKEQTISDGRSTLNKIDEIVTNVIDRVMSTSQSSQLPSTSQHVADSTPASTSLIDPSGSKRKLSPKPSDSIEIPSTTLQMQSTLLDLNNVDQLQELYRQNPGLLGQLAPTSLPLHSMQSLLKPTNSALINQPSIPTTLTLANSNAARFLLQQQHPSSAFVDPSTAQLLLPPTPQPTPAMAGFAAPFPLLGGTAAVIRALQQQQVSNFATAAQLAHSSAPWSLNSYDSNNAIPGTSVQTNEQQSKSVDSKPLSIEIADETKSESDKPAKLKAPKEKTNNDQLSTESKQSRKPSKSASTTGSVNAKPTSSPSPQPSKEKKISPKKQKELEDSLSEAREQIEQLESQLNAERTKFSVHKRRMDQLRDKLKKKDDELQTARIDYACQKTDNGVLRQKVDALKAENTALKERLGDSPVQVPTSVPSTSAKPATTSTASAASSITARRPRRRPDRSQAPTEPSDETEGSQPPSTAPAPRKRRRTAATPNATTTKPETDSEAEEPENERRQSKRLSAARSRVLYN